MKIERFEEMTGPLVFREYTDEEIKEAYKLAKAAFTADDLQLFTELRDDDVSVDEAVAQMEETQKQIDQGKA